MPAQSFQEWIGSNPQYSPYGTDVKSTNPFGFRIGVGNQQMPDVAKMKTTAEAYQKYLDDYKYGELSGQAQKAYGTDNINSLYKLLAGNLSQNQAQAGANARQTAASQAGGLLNQQAFITNRGNQAQAPYAQAFGNLYAQQGQAVQNANSALYQALYNISRAQSGDELARQQLAQQQAQWQAQMDANQAGGIDYLMGILGAVAPSVAPYVLFPSLLNNGTRG